MRRPEVPVLAAALLVPLLACAGEGEPEPAPDPALERAAFWDSLQELCGQAFRGTVVRDTPSNPDSPFANATLVMHVRECGPDVIRIPFHVGEDRSRTWEVTRLPEGFRLKHHHLHRDGTPDEVHLYGGDSAGPGSSEWQEFPADAFTAGLVPGASANIWTLEIIPGEMFAYALRREGTDRAFRVEFDLTLPVAPPPPPWGG